MLLSSLDSLCLCTCGPCMRALASAHALHLVLEEEGTAHDCVEYLQAGADGAGGGGGGVGAGAGAGTGAGGAAFGDAQLAHFLQTLPATARGSLLSGLGAFRTAFTDFLHTQPTGGVITAATVQTFFAEFRAAQRLREENRMAGVF